MPHPANLTTHLLFRHTSGPLLPDLQEPTSHPFICPISSTRSGGSETLMSPSLPIGIFPGKHTATFATTCATPAITSFATSLGCRIKHFGVQANIRMTTSARTEDGTWQQAITNAPASGCHLSHTNIAVFSSIPVGETEEILASNSAIQNQNLWRRLVRAPPIRF